MTSHRYTPPVEDPLGDCDEEGSHDCMSAQELVERLFSIPLGLRVGINASTEISVLNASVKAAVKVAVEAEIKKPALQALLSTIQSKNPAAQIRGVSAGESVFLTIARVGTSIRA